LAERMKHQLRCECYITSAFMAVRTYYMQSNKNNIKTIFKPLLDLTPDIDMSESIDGEHSKKAHMHLISRLCSPTIATCSEPFPSIPFAHSETATLSPPMRNSNFETETKGRKRSHRMSVSSLMWFYSFPTPKKP
jgi:hypothetical protein